MYSLFTAGSGNSGQVRLLFQGASKNPQMKLVGGLTLRKLAFPSQSAYLQPHLEELDKNELSNLKLPPGNLQPHLEELDKELQALTCGSGFRIWKPLSFLDITGGTIRCRL